MQITQTEPFTSGQAINSEGQFLCLSDNKNSLWNTQSDNRQSWFEVGKLSINLEPFSAPVHSLSSCMSQQATNIWSSLVSSTHLIALALQRPDWHLSWRDVQEKVVQDNLTIRGTPAFLTWFWIMSCDIREKSFFPNVFALFLVRMTTVWAVALSDQVIMLILIYSLIQSL